MFRELDYYSLDPLYSEEERMARDTVRAFVSAEVLPDIGTHFTAGTLPAGAHPPVRRAGPPGLVAGGLRLPRHEPHRLRAHLPGARARRQRRAQRSARCRARWSCIPIWAFGSEEQKQRWLPRMATGEVIGCFGLTEPDFGSNPSGMLTTATPDGRGGYRLNGTKRWITNGSIAHVALVWAKLDGEVRGFLVPTDAPGLHRPRHPRQVVAARLGHQRAHPRGLRGRRRRAAAGGRAGSRGRCRA